jgi:hypothetical protein
MYLKAILHTIQSQYTIDMMLLCHLRCFRGHLPDCKVRLDHMPTAKTHLLPAAMTRRQILQIQSAKIPSSLLRLSINKNTKFLL